MSGQKLGHLVKSNITSDVDPQVSPVVYNAMKKGNSLKSSLSGERSRALWALLFIISERSFGQSCSGALKCTTVNGICSDVDGCTCAATDYHDAPADTCRPSMSHLPIIY